MLVFFVVFDLGCWVKFLGLLGFCFSFVCNAVWVFVALFCRRLCDGWVGVGFAFCLILWSFIVVCLVDFFCFWCRLTPVYSCVGDIFVLCGFLVDVF